MMQGVSLKPEGSLKLKDVPAKDEGFLAIPNVSNMTIYLSNWTMMAVASLVFEDPREVQPLD